MHISAIHINIHKYTDITRTVATTFTVVSLSTNRNCKYWVWDSHESAFRVNKYNGMRFEDKAQCNETGLRQASSWAIIFDNEDLQPSKLRQVTNSKLHSPE